MQLNAKSTQKAVKQVAVGIAVPLTVTVVGVVIAEKMVVPGIDKFFAIRKQRQADKPSDDEYTEQQS